MSPPTKEGEGPKEGMEEAHHICCRAPAVLRYEEVAARAASGPSGALDCRKLQQSPTQSQWPPAEAI